MTEPLYHTEAYLRRFPAKVTQVLPEGVVLDRTAFYPGGGGQPSDLGFLEDESGGKYQVTKVYRAEGQVLHQIEGKPPLVGTNLEGEIDWDRRYRLMRTHTALHILCGVIWRDYGALVTGGNMEPLAARMDFELERMSADFAREVEEKANREVEAARPVVIRILPREEAFQIPDLIRTKINLLPEGIREVRTVEIVGLDLQADGGTHVANTQEVGRIKVVGHESKGRINKRLRIAVAE
ncbi:MAG: alanyl-tRNA editing protein [Chloroflexi bacterium]|nr:alanyl-tRNA editing protein [Chloroflexota bacterium]